MTQSEIDLLQHELLLRGVNMTGILSNTDRFRVDDKGLSVEITDKVTMETRQFPMSDFKYIEESYTKEGSLEYEKTWNQCLEDLFNGLNPHTKD